MHTMRHSHLKQWLVRIKVVLDMSFISYFLLHLKFFKKERGRKTSFNSTIQNHGDLASRYSIPLKAKKVIRSH